MLRRSLCALALPLVACACGSGAGSSPGTTSGAGPTAVSVASIDPCKLISASVAQQALGEAVRQPTRSSVTGVNGCDWISADPNTSTDMVTLEVDTRDSFDAAEQSSGQSGGATISKVGGLGDDAFFYITGPNTTLEVRKGALAIYVTVTKGDTMPRDAEVAVARAAIGNLP